MEHNHSQGEIAAYNFLKEVGYNAESSPGVMSSCLKQAIKSHQKSQIDLWTLGCILEEFETNPSVHICKENDAIINCIGLTFYLYEEDYDSINDVLDTLYALV